MWVRSLPDCMCCLRLNLLSHVQIITQDLLHKTSSLELLRGILAVIYYRLLMWLINVLTLELEEFVGVDIPRYAILSHTWVKGEEVTFSEMRNPDAVLPEAGWLKIEETCIWAARDRLKYAWVDTCCIDKSSSAELSEAINSMFRWYKRAEVCYVFLDDLDDFSRKWAGGEDMDELQASMKHCRWFTRSWTLQELIAPLQIKFFNKDWRFCFTKAAASEALSAITGIDGAVLRHRKDLSAVSVAQKMSWAATRQATRKEDVAYSLLGIFGINMPLLYGEEEKAFLRLQQKIISSCPDTTIFAWRLPRQISQDTSKYPRNVYHGVMASSPAFFRLCANVASLSGEETYQFSRSNRGIRLQAKLTVLYLKDTGNGCLVLPVCKILGQLYCIRLRNAGNNCFVRQDAYNLVRTGYSNICLEINADLLKQISPSNTTSGQTENSILMNYRERVLEVVLPPNMKVFGRWPLHDWDEEDAVFFGPKTLPDNLSWASLRVFAWSNSPFYNPNAPADIEFYFYAFGWASDPRTRPPPRCTVYRLLGETFSRNLGKLNEEARSWDGYNVAHSLLGMGLSEQHFVVAGRTEREAVLLVYDISREENVNKCLNPFWRVTFSWRVVPIHQALGIPNQNPTGLICGPG